MKKILCLLLLICICSCKKNDEKSAAAKTAARAAGVQTGPALDTTFLLRKSFAGRVRVGAFTDTLPRLFRAAEIRRTTIQQEGLRETIVEVGDSTGPALLRINQDCTRRCRMVRISVLDGRYRTKEKLGIGSSFAELKKAYKPSWTDVAEGFAVARVDELSMSFLFPVGEYPPYIHRQKNVPIADSARVQRILITD